MPRARRLASTVVVAALAVTGLAACNRAPDVAVYYGNAKAITEAQVQQIWDGSMDNLGVDREGKKVMPLSRQEIVARMVERDAMRQFGKTKGFTATPVPADGIAQLAQQLNMKPDAPLVTLLADFEGWAAASQQASQGGALAEADLRDVFERLKSGGTLNANPMPTFEQFASSLNAEDKQTLSSALEMRNGLRAAASDLKIKFNPRYTAPSLALSSTSAQGGAAVPLVEVTLGSNAAASAPVTDVP